jgi:hypothetical protein
MIGNTGFNALMSINFDSGRIFAVGANDSSQQMFTVPYSGGTFGSVGGIGGAFFSDIISHSNLASGHPGTMYFANSNGGDSRIYSLDTYGLAAYNYHTLTGKNTANMVVVVAPEPGALAGLALGAILVLRRRRAN